MLSEVHTPKRRLLAVDDDAGSAELVARLGTRCGYDARPISDPRELPRLLAQWKPDVLTLDLCMPEEDGITVFDLLKTGGFCGHLIIISGQDGWLRKVAGRLAQAHGLNFTREMAKPVDVSALREVLRTLPQLP